MACAAVCGVSTSLPSFIHGTSRVENAVPVISFLLMCAWLVRPEEAPPGDEVRLEASPGRLDLGCVAAPRFALRVLPLSQMRPYQMGDSAASLVVLRQAPESVFVPGRQPVSRLRRATSGSRRRTGRRR